MKYLILSTALLIAALGQSQNNYEKGMSKAFESWRNNNPTEAMHMFERISQVEMDQWLPFYYAAQINIVNSFMTKDEQGLKAQLTKAQDLLDSASSISPENPEIMVLQNLLYTSWIAFDGATYGPALSGKVISLYAKAEALAPDNPRVVLNKAEWNIGSAKYFGQDTSPYCKDVEHALDLLENEDPAIPFSPKWGKERALQILETCGK